MVGVLVLCAPRLYREVYVNRSFVHFYDKDGRTYKYTMESSLDGEAWVPIFTDRAASGRDEFVFPRARRMRFVRICGVNNAIPMLRIFQFLLDFVGDKVGVVFLCCFLLSLYLQVDEDKIVRPALCAMLHLLLSFFRTMSRCTLFAAKFAALCLVWVSSAFRKRSQAGAFWFFTFSIEGSRLCRVSLLNPEQSLYFDMDARKGGNYARVELAEYDAPTYISHAHCYVQAVPSQSCDHAPV